jgi:ADP-dependent NAD(P)H-hydrate dehydratase / NAD(P)H-hydrate epimerase
MKILNAAQIRSADAYTIENEPIASINLMERASKACFLWIKSRVSKKVSIKVFSGMGNNGGDGLAIARMLLVSGHNVSVYKIRHRDQASEDFITNEKRLCKIKGFKINEISDVKDIPNIEKDDIVIDAIIGSGLNSALQGLLAEVVKSINLSGCNVIAVDMPSGLFCEDNSNNEAENIIRADYTLSFQLPKLAFLFAENEQYVGVWNILDIKLDMDFIKNLESDYYLLNREFVRQLYIPRKRFSHKGDYGHALLIAGSKGKSGAAILSAKAAIKSGLGLITASVPASCYLPIQTNVPEAMCETDSENDFVSTLVDITKYKVVAAGPGLGMEKQTQNVLRLLIQNSSNPLVLDADALNILSENPTWLPFLPKNSILTPHPGEMDRLVGKSLNGYERLQKAREFAFKYGVIVVLKGAHTAIISPDKNVFFNSTGNPGMATGGSGDVLTGIILSWLSQGYTPLQSSLISVYIHGLAADLGIKNSSMESLIAGEIINNIGKAIKMTFY